MKHISHKETSRILGKRIVELRRKQKMSQSRVCTESNIDPSTLSRLERGDLNVTLSTLCKIAHSLGIKVKDLFD
jgi:transcriptional regulator with XRE-family HTH domain